MAQITITIPNDRVQDVLDTFRYEVEIDGQPNPETPQLFMKRIVKEWVQVKVHNHLTDKANQEIIINDINIT